MYQELCYLKGLQAEVEKVQSFTLPQSNPGLLLTLDWICFKPKRM